MTGSYITTETVFVRFAGEPDKDKILTPPEIERVRVSRRKSLVEVTYAGQITGVKAKEDKFPFRKNGRMLISFVR